MCNNTSKHRNFANENNQQGKAHASVVQDYECKRFYHKGKE